MVAIGQVTHLARVVELNEGTKTILGYSREVNLRALDAMVRSVRGGAQLRGFNEVASQMRQWCRELNAVVEQLMALVGQQVKLVSAHARQERMGRLLSSATRSDARFESVTSHAQAEREVQGDELRKIRRKVRGALESLEQLGLMASVLSRAALIEAAHADAGGLHALSTVSKEFAARSHEVNETIRVILKRDREAI